MEIIMEKNEFLRQEIITYLGNKRTLLEYIRSEVLIIQEKLKISKTINIDLFSGSGIVARMLKQYSSKLYANDLEEYSSVINNCFLTNEDTFDWELYNKLHSKILRNIKNKPIVGFISKNYAPVDNSNIKRNERVFYTKENALFLDSAIHYINKYVPVEMKCYFFGPLLSEASVKNNTAGVFRGFYKDKETGIGKFGGTGSYSLTRILAPIELKKPIFSNYRCNFKVFNENSNELVKKLDDIDIAYIDPPYNQHPYGANYFMLNLIIDGKTPKNISKVSGISKWLKKIKL
jgi:adenine-specific DNA-methyltransferase